MRRIVIASLLAAASAWGSAAYAQPAGTFGPAKSECQVDASVASVPCADAAVLTNSNEAILATVGVRPPAKRGVFSDSLAALHGLIDGSPEGAATVTRSGPLRVARVKPATLPEPTTWVMMLFGFGAIGGLLRRKIRRSEARFNAKIRRIEAGETL